MTMPATPKIETLAVYVNDRPMGTGLLAVDRPTTTQVTNQPEPDPRWEHTDRHGHYHARSDDEGEPYPTLKAVHVRVPCDGSCGGACEGEGYFATRYTCRVCGEEITPGTIPGPHTFQLPGPLYWSVRVTGATVVPVGETVSVRVEAPEGLVWFGVAIATHQQGTRDTVVTTLAGAGPLGSRALGGQR